MLSELYDLLNFYINKYMGRYYTPDELDKVVDDGQMALFNQLRPQYATSQRMQDALAPFLAEYNFNTTNTVSGVIVVPSNVDYMTLLAINITYTVSGRGTQYESVPIVSKDEKAIRLQSQLDPVTTTSPIAEMLAPRYFRIYPNQGYSGTVVFFRRPRRPQYVYNTISGRVIVYDSNRSVDLEWGEEWRNSIILKSLETLGINLSDQEVEQFAQAKTTFNAQNFNNR